MENELQIERFRNETEPKQQGVHAPLFRLQIDILVSSISEIHGRVEGGTGTETVVGRLVKFT
jgi:hypothetical protein